MNRPELENLHDGSIQEIEIGPNRDVTLVVDLWDGEHGYSTVRAHFDAIDNFRRVKDFLLSIKCPRVRVARPPLDRIDTLTYTRTEPSSPRCLALLLELDHSGCMVIRCKNVAFEYIS